MCFKGANVHGCYTNVPMAETTLKDIWILEIAPFALKRIGKLTWQMPKSTNAP